MDQKPDNLIIRGILENKSQVIQDVYKECLPMVERMVINSGGNLDLARDIFQEGWIVVINKLTSGELDLTCKFSTYIYAICKKLWLQEKRKRISRIRLLPSEPEILEEPEPLFENDNKSVKKLFYKHFRLISKDCQKMLILHVNMASIEEIRKIMNYPNTHYVMDRKYRCKKSLMQKIFSDPQYKSVKNEYSEQIQSIF